MNAVAPLFAAKPPMMAEGTTGCEGLETPELAVGVLGDCESCFCLAILSFKVSLLKLLLERGRPSSSGAESGTAAEDIGEFVDGEKEASSASLLARAIFSFNVSLPELLSDAGRIDSPASNEADRGVEGTAGDPVEAANSASRFCRAIFSLRVSLPELLSALFGCCLAP